MNELSIAAFTMAAIFLAIALVFYTFKGKACGLISGYNFKSKEERRTYNEEKIARDFATLMLKSSLIFTAGALGCALISGYFFGIALIVWSVYFIPHIGWSDKRYDKYRR